MMTREFVLLDSAATERLGACLAQVMTSGVVWLEGELGAGKTTLVRGWLRALGHAGAVKSPTYTLVEPYQLGDTTVYHFDLYRLGDPDELEAMGGRDYFAADTLCLVEWPERGRGFLAAPQMTVHLQYQGEQRRAAVTAPAALLDRVKQDWQ